MTKNTTKKQSYNCDVVGKTVSVEISITTKSLDKNFTESFDIATVKDCSSILECGVKKMGTQRATVQGATFDWSLCPLMAALKQR
ncbi:MAG: hypothetical protein GY795_27020 [Desulfobacterales bacterium]|nr:hypothetical protein [Desulfobacterales bacterium]